MGSKEQYGELEGVLTCRYDKNTLYKCMIVSKNKEKIFSKDFIVSTDHYRKPELVYVQRKINCQVPTSNQLFYSRTAIPLISGSVTEEGRKEEPEHQTLAARSSLYQ